MDFLNNLPINFNFDIFGWLETMATSPWKAAWVLFCSGGWILFVWVFAWGIWHIWLGNRRGNFARAQRYYMLALHLPKQTEQSPKAVENMFSHLSGLYRGLTMKEALWEGQLQTTLSLEIVSIEGHIKYFIRVGEKFRDLVEATIFSQYPDAEIIETVDYAKDFPQIYPDEKYDMWGSEFVPKKPAAFPFKTFSFFEHNPSKEYFKDPMASFLEFLSKLKKGENLWIQFLVQPTTDDWKKSCEMEIDKITGKFKVGAKPEDMFKMLSMTPAERQMVEQMQMKISKGGFLVKIRIVYVAEKQVFRKGPMIGAMKGAFSQYNGLNEFKTYKYITPKTDYFWQKNKIFEYLSAGFYKTWHTRQNRLMRAYKHRDMWWGGPMFVLNAEELATIYHFPMTEVKAPLMQKTESKKGEPPAALPTE